MVIPSGVLPIDSVGRHVRISLVVALSDRFLTGGAAGL
jgi:hypothetical protein